MHGCRRLIKGVGVPNMNAAGYTEMYASGLIHSLGKPKLHVHPCLSTALEHSRAFCSLEGNPA